MTLVPLRLWIRAYLSLPFLAGLIYGQAAPPPASAPPTQARENSSQPVFRPGVQPDLPPDLQREINRAAGIRILVLEGQRQPNRLTEGIFAMPVVEIRNRDDRPIEGAAVTFVLPGGSGAGARFADSTLEKTFISNFQGQAAAEGYTPNPAEGTFTVRVKAEYLGEKIELLIPQASTRQTQAEAERQKISRSRRKWYWIAGGAVAGVITAVLLTRDGSTSSGPTSIIITPGGPVIGGR